MVADSDRSMIDADDVLMVDSEWLAVDFDGRPMVGEFDRSKIDVDDL